MPRVLMLNDSPDETELYQWGLEQEGYEVTVASSSDPAAMTRQDADVLVIDDVAPADLRGSCSLPSAPVKERRRSSC
ncbi:MAG TPA: hypothetical protein VM364_21195 [Vicinamibacterales bacterium]|nr:hypothetical protein [Vicinamibacterales bacterium]